MTEELLKMDRFEEAKLGEGVRFNTRFNIYDHKRVLMILQRDGMSHEEASEYWEQSIVKEWVGTDTPAFLFKKEEQNERA